MPQAIETFTISLVFETQLKTVGRWQTRQWELSGILSDPDGPSSVEGPILLRESRESAQYMWKGLQIELYSDGAEGYWYNLLSDVPFAFVLCEQDPDDDEAVPIPITVTVNQDEAGGHLETDNLILSGPLPVDIRDAVERYVVNNFVPEVRKKRKRRDWFVESQERERNRAHNLGNPDTGTEFQ